MKIGILGGTGAIGTSLTNYLVKNGNDIRIFSRKSTPPSHFHSNPKIEFITTKEVTSNVLEGLDCIINLAGESVIGGRWTEERKKQLRDSRILLTTNLIDEIKKLTLKPKILIQGSAIGYYGMFDEGNFSLDENSEAGNDFLASLCVEWENAANPAVDLGIKTYWIRTGIVLMPDAGALSQMLPPFKLFIGGPMGSGKQFMSWIHIQDMIQGMVYILNKLPSSGKYNFTAPNPVSNLEFSKTLAQVLNRPCIFSVPSVVVKSMFGESSEVILKGQNVIPKKLIEIGYKFQYDSLSTALNNLLS